MSTNRDPEVEVAVIGAGVVGCAVALAVARRGVSVVLVEAEEEVGLGASGTNSGIVHTGFDSVPGELETELILRSATLREPVFAALGVPLWRCGAEMRPADPALAAAARGRGVTVAEQDDGSLSVPGEAVTDPVAYTRALAEAACRAGGELRLGFRVGAIERVVGSLTIRDAGGYEPVRCRVAVNCAGLRADEVARMVGDDSFEIFPRKGEFLVFEPTGLDRILLPVPSKRTKGVLVFPTLDGHVIAGPTAIDQQDKDDWSVRLDAKAEIVAKASPMYPALADLEPVFAYAGLRPAGRGTNYLLGVSPACESLVNVAAIRSTGLTASLGIAEHVCGLLAGLGARLGPEAPLEAVPAPEPSGPWWRRTAEYRQV